MATWIVASSVLVVALTLVLLADRLGTTPGEKRVHLFEDEQGNRANPFEALSEGASDSAAVCRNCGHDVASESYRYCPSCFDSWSG